MREKEREMGWWPWVELEENILCVRSVVQHDQNTLYIGMKDSKNKQK